MHPVQYPGTHMMTGYAATLAVTMSSEHHAISVPCKVRVCQSHSAQHVNFASFVSMLGMRTHCGTTRPLHLGAACLRLTLLQVINPNNALINHPQIRTDSGTSAANLVKEKHVLLYTSHQMMGCLPILSITLRCQHHAPCGMVIDQYLFFTNLKQHNAASL